MNENDKEKVIEIIKSKFNNLKFNQERHTYTVDGKKLISVSGLIKDFVEPFDADKISEYVAQSRGITKQEVLKEWKDIKNQACRFGTRVHDFGERYASDKYKVKVDITFYDVYQHLGPEEKLSPQEEALKNFWRDKPSYIVPILLELRMYSEELEYAGTADLIFVDTRDGSLIIGDYKTNKDLFKQHKNQKLTGIFSDLPDTPYSKYEIQLSFYKILLEQTGFKVSRTFIVWLKESGDYEIFDTDDYTKKLKGYLTQRKIDKSW